MLSPPRESHSPGKRGWKQSHNPPGDSRAPGLAPPLNAGTDHPAGIGAVRRHPQRDWVSCPVSCSQGSGNGSRAPLRRSRHSPHPPWMGPPGPGELISLGLKDHCSVSSVPDQGEMPLGRRAPAHPLAPWQLLAPRGAVRRRWRPLGGDPGTEGQEKGRGPGIAERRGASSARGRRGRPES